MKKTFDRVWDAIEDDPAIAENLNLRSTLMIALKSHVETEGLTQSQAANLFGISAEQVAELLRGRIDEFEVDLLVKMVAAAGLRIQVQVSKVRPL